jgi:hypothetical protein
MGRGTEKQFQIYGSPFLTKTNFSFTPKSNFGAKDPLYNGKECFGEDLTSYPKLTRLELKWLTKSLSKYERQNEIFQSVFHQTCRNKKITAANRKRSF